MLEEEKSWWKKKGFYTCACVMLIGVMAVGAVVFRNAKQKNSGEMLAEIEKEISENDMKKGETGSGENDSLAASAKVTPVPTAAIEVEQKNEEANKEEERKRKEKAETEERERKEKIKKAARKEAAAVSAKVKHMFDEEKGLLWPVPAGEPLLKYSMDKTVYFKTLAQYKYNPGLLIGAKVGMDVKAAADGKVTEVTKEDDHGTVIKMDLGNDYMVMYGQLADVTVKPGDEVKEGDVLGKVSEPTKYFSEEGAHLYFQVNQGKETVDPMLLLR